MPLEVAIGLTILSLPLLAFAVQVFVGRMLPWSGHYIPTGAMGLAFVGSLLLFAKVLGESGGMEPQTWELSWIKIGTEAKDLSLSFGVLVDNLTVIMLVVVTSVSFFVHLYSWGYMHGEERYSRFFAYLALFSFSMLGLILVDSLLFLLVFWELVGVCSYLLIGFYFNKPSAARASMKAFITTRIGDVGFFLAVIIALGVVGSVSYADLFASVKGGLGPWSQGLLTFTAICLFCGAVGKSAQFPLHVWLPDAMEGPTPVSALIHAATMVAAGVYMVARLFPFLAGPAYFARDFWSSDALLVVAYVGGFTAFLAATIAVAQTDIKKVLAYSTISQLGYMVMGVGVGAFAAGMFHLWTHAFFKALLFLGAGSVIHAVHTNEMSQMGGLRRKMPITYWTFLLGTLALAGVPFFSGFASKEGILTNAMAFALHRGGVVFWLPFVFGIVSAALTAFYMGRVMFLTFWGKPRDQEKYDHAHESPWTMTVPLCSLAAAAVIAGGLGAIPILFHQKWFNQLINPERIVHKYMEKKQVGAAPTRERDDLLASVGAVPPIQSHGEEEAHARFEESEKSAARPTMWLSLVMLGIGAGGSYLVFGGRWKGRDLPKEIRAIGWYKKVLVELYYIDWFYYRYLVRGLMNVKTVAGLFDKWVIDGIVNFCGHLTRWTSALSGWVDYSGVDGAVRGTANGILDLGKRARRVQTGKLQEYVSLSIILFGGMILLFILMQAFK